jgi:hypothetical protein
MKFQPSAYQIISTLDRLGVKREGDQPNHKGWLSILCPNHQDENFGSCSINLTSGFIKCFVCGYGSKGDSRKSIVNLVMDRMGFDFNQAKQFIEEGLYSSLNQTIVPKEKPKRKIKPIYSFTSIDLNADKWYYTKLRGITQEFVDTFNIKRVVSGWFNDYFIIPIIDSKKNINEYEGRKLAEYEKLCEFYVLNLYEQSFDKLKKNFNKLCESHDIKLNKKTYQVFIEGKLASPDIFGLNMINYLLKPKTLYIANSRCQETLWNIDNLNFDEALFAVEGLGSVCKIWSNISKNVTSIFGVSITEAQIEYLKKFKKVVYIPDFDKAGFDSVDFLRRYLDNLFICDIHSDDTNEQYVKDIINCEQLTPHDYNYKYAVEFRFVR